VSIFSQGRPDHYMIIYTTKEFMSSHHIPSYSAHSIMRARTRGVASTREYLSSVRPRPRPKPSRGLGLPGLVARAPTFGSLSPQKPGLSHGFQAEPSPHITNVRCTFAISFTIQPKISSLHGEKCFTVNLKVKNRLL